MVNVTWYDVDKFVKELSIPKGTTGVYGIPRGGNVLATMISYYWNLPLLQAPTRNCIVVDDIADTGQTLVHYQTKGYYIITMYYHKDSVVVPDYWKHEKFDDWVIFPWEYKEC